MVDELKPVGSSKGVMVVIESPQMRRKERSNSVGSSDFDIN